MLDVELAKRLSREPQTYKTILREKYGRNTMTTILSGRMNELVKYGRACATLMHGSRSNERMFFSPEKKYVVVFRKSRDGSHYYYCRRAEREHDVFSLKDARELRTDVWVPVGDVQFDFGEVVKCL